jgi:site-specific DNA-methyltransferase (adenine-specific)
MARSWIICGDCLDIMAMLPENSVEAVVTDPPYGLRFMGKAWDHGVPGAAFWREALRVARPGAHLLAFGGTRTSHRLTCAIEDAGWRVLDTLCWLYGSGFPKSHDISKAIDKEAGAERGAMGFLNPHSPKTAMARANTYSGFEQDGPGKGLAITVPATEAARQWHGWGTALKPAYEPITLAMKPLDGTYAQNTLRWGCAGINVDGCRIGTGDTLSIGAGKVGYGSGMDGSNPGKQHPQGRWPPNVILDEQSAAMLDQQSGESVSSGGADSIGAFRGGRVFGKGRDERWKADPGFGDTGGASRFFYCAKASRSERNAGLEGMEAQSPTTYHDETAEGAAQRGRKPRHNTPTQNRHPTVKPLALMRWLVRLVTPPGGTVLDPFAGSGTTGIAAKQEGFGYILIDNDPENCAIAKRRVEHWLC